MYHFNPFTSFPKRKSRTAASPKRGAAALTALLLLGASIAVLSYVVDSTRTTSDASQLKHATDAAATATSMAYAKDSSVDVQAMAERYVLANLGLDDEQLKSGLEITVMPYSYDGYEGFRVSATFKAAPAALGGIPQPVTVSSAAVAIYNPIEIAMVLPNTLTEGTDELNALRDVTLDFAELVIEDKPDRWMALVPYSDIVNVYDAAHPDRITAWAEPGALKPVELTSLFMSNSYGISDMASRGMPNRRAKKLAVYRGVHPGEDYNWTESPLSGFKVRYRPSYVPWTNYPGLPYIHWRGPNPFFGKASGDIDNRYIVADPGAPTAALLPLTNDMDDIESRLNKMETGWNVNYAIAMGWGAMALAPAFRGTSGWGDEELPLDFSDEDTTNIKAVVMLAKTDGNFFDSNWYNFYVGEGATDLDESPIGSADDSTAQEEEDDDEGGATWSQIAERFQSVCESYRAHGIKFYFIGVRSGNPQNINSNAFGLYAYPGLLTCADSAEDVVFLDNDNFADAEYDIKEKLEKIAAELESQSNYARLVE